MFWVLLCDWRWNYTMHYFDFTFNYKRHKEDPKMFQIRAAAKVPEKLSKTKNVAET